jgi:hypothetical protein
MEKTFESESAVKTPTQPDERLQFEIRELTLEELMLVGGGGGYYKGKVNGN